MKFKTLFAILLAFTLVDVLGRMEDHREIFRFAAGGFRDFTRIASSDPQMWHDVCIANREALAATLDVVSRDLGFGRVEVVDPSHRGAADVSFVAPHVATLDGLGVVGGGAHSPREVAELASLPQTLQRAALLLYRLSQEPAPGPQR